LEHQRFTHQKTRCAGARVALRLLSCDRASGMSKPSQQEVHVTTVGSPTKDLAHDVLALLMRVDKAQQSSAGQGDDKVVPIRAHKQG